MSKTERYWLVKSPARIILLYVLPCVVLIILVYARIEAKQWMLREVKYGTLKEATTSAADMAETIAETWLAPRIAMSNAVARLMRDCESIEIVLVRDLQGTIFEDVKRGSEPFDFLAFPKSRETNIYGWITPLGDKRLLVEREIRVDSNVVGRLFMVQSAREQLQDNDLRDFVRDGRVCTMSRAARAYFYITDLLEVVLRYVLRI